MGGSYTMRKPMTSDDDAVPGTWWGWRPWCESPWMVILSAVFFYIMLAFHISAGLVGVFFLSLRVC